VKETRIELNKTLAKVYKSANGRMVFMSRSIYNLVGKSAAISAGVAILLSSGGAHAAMSNTPEARYVSNPQDNQLLAQSSRYDRRDNGDVIIDDRGSNSSDPTPYNRDRQRYPNQDNRNIQTSKRTRFTCDYSNGQYTVMYHPESRPGEAYPWATPRALGDGWTPQRRCEAISQRLESYRPDGLVELRTAVQNRQNVICATTEQVPSCRIVLTVPPGKNAEVVRDQIFQNLTVADSGEITAPVNTFTGSGSLGNLLGSGGTRNVRRHGNIKLQPFLDRADGGTGKFPNATSRNGARTAPSRSNYQFKPNF
jgi:hypothetical protein